MKAHGVFCDTPPCFLYQQGQNPAQSPLSTLSLRWLSISLRSAVTTKLLALVYDILPPLNCLAFKHKFRSYSVIVFCHETSNNAVCIRFPRSYYPNTSQTVRRALTTRDFTGDFGGQTPRELSIRTAPSTAVAN